MVGNEVVAAIERRAKEGDFRSNLHRGGMATVAQISDEERAIAIKATQTLGPDVAGVDILRATRGPLVMEVNASPGLEGVETTTGVDIASRMIAWIERQATPEFCLKIGGQPLDASLSAVCGAFLRKLWRRFFIVRGHRHYGFTGRSGLDTLRRWLDEIGISFLSAIPARHCICRICRISTVFLMPKLTW